ncbi:hypothetical protein [Alicyclobacillus sp. ALC3]|uniref:hypothetical protein n=1 Tax=Alicyclobacillus sp. ALC3 TaxID=2796143 RepID=UPI002379BA1E|nr:hypothetical protein [Alicyclobacillus sp. ALC3]WDL97085.1 hypothetical protein JC200_22925 [Alicyclobacillus sp. ALC3]
MSENSVRALQAVQLITLAILLTWALAVAGSTVRRHWPIGGSDLPSGSYVAASTTGRTGNVRTALLSAWRQLALDIRIGG